MTMIVKLETEKVLVIEPENVAEMAILKSFDGCNLAVRVAKPFEANVDSLVAKKV